MLGLLSYLLCLLFGFPSINNASLNSDPFLNLYHRRCLQLHSSLEGLGRRVNLRMKELIEAARTSGLIGRAIVLSADMIHSPYWGGKKGLFKSVWSTMMNRPFPGMLPLICVDLASKLPVFVARFRGGERSPSWRRKKEEDGEAFYCGLVLDAIGFLKGCGIRVTSFIADRAFTSTELVTAFEDELRTKYILPLKSNSKLRKHISYIKEWFEVKNGLVGIKRNVMYNGVMTNLLVLRLTRKGRRPLTLMYATNYNDSPAKILKRYRRRGAHEGLFGRLSTIGFHHRPGTNVLQIKAHFLLCMALEYLLEELRRQMHLEKMDIKSFRSLLSRPGYIWNQDERLNVIVFVNRSLLKRIRKSTIKFAGLRIRLIEQRKPIGIPA